MREGRQQAGAEIQSRERKRESEGVSISQRHQQLNQGEMGPKVRVGLAQWSTINTTSVSPLLPVPLSLSLSLALALSLSLPTHIYKSICTISFHASTPDWCLHAQTRWQTLNALWHAAVSQLHLNKTWHNSDTCWATETWTRPFSFRQVGDCTCELKTVLAAVFLICSGLIFFFFEWDFFFFQNSELKSLNK